MNVTLNEIWETRDVNFHVTWFSLKMILKWLWKELKVYLLTRWFFYKFCEAAGLGFEEHSWKGSWGQGTECLQVGLMLRHFVLSLPTLVSQQVSKEIVKMGCSEVSLRFWNFLFCQNYAWAFLLLYTCCGL